MQTGESTITDVGLKPLAERSRVDIRLERGAGLAQRVGGAVELAGAVIAAADHGAHAAVEIGDHHCGLARAIVAAVLAQLGFDLAVGIVLQVAVERGAHHEITIGNGFGERVDELAHLVEGVVEIIVRRAGVAAIDRRRRIAPGAVDLAFGHEAVVDQVIEHDVGAGAGRGQVDQRGEFARRLEQSGEHRRLGQRHVAHRFAEIVFRRRVDAESAAAQIGAVEIKLEDFVLAQMGLEPQRQERLVDFALDGALVAEEQILGELLGDGRAALHHAAGLRVGHQRAERAVKVDAEMLVEAAVFGRQRRLDQIVGHFVERHRIVVLDAAVADLVAVAVEKRHREIGFLQPVFVRGLAHRRDAERQHEEQAAGAERRHL